MTSVIMLFIELLLDIVGLVTGGIIWAHSSESKIRKAWECWLPLCRYFCCAIM